MTAPSVERPPAGTEHRFRPLIEEILRGNRSWAEAWQLAGDDGSTSWLRLTHRAANMPDQGWKLHVSATIASAEEVLRRTLPILFADTASFKLARTRGALAELNGGFAGPSQVGKFITVYPNDDTQAVRLASALDRATRGLRGPRVPSDKPLTPESLVHYRYGGFRSRRVRNAVGSVKAAILTPEGVAIPDERLTGYRRPEWATDPFAAAGITREPEPPSPIIAGRYLVLAPLHRSVRGSVHLAMDLDDPKRCVLKRARRGAGTGLDGRDATDRLRREAELLTRLMPDPRFPAMYDLVEQDGDVYLVMEDVEGQTLEERVREISHHGGRVPAETALTWAVELAAALATVHDHGILYRDLKSANVIVAPDGHIRLLDFDSALDPAVDHVSALTGTFGYMAPEHEAGAAPSAQDDVYGLGAVFYFLATGVEPSNAPNRHRLLDRPIALLNPEIPEAIATVIARCLDHDPAIRYASAQEVVGALAAIDPAGAAPGTLPSALRDAEAEALARRAASDAARRLGDTLVAVSKVTTDGAGRYWLCAHTERDGVRSPDLNTGSAGTVLALAELVDAFGDPRHREVLAAGAHALLDAPRPDGPPLAGLYVGESGLGAALLRTGQVLDDAELITAASAHGKHVATMPWASPDLFNGTAGRLRFQLWLWDETGDPAHLDAAIAAGDRLLETATVDAAGAWWVIPDGFEALSGQSQPGYAHGAAGIADALLDLHDATGDARYRETAVEAGRWIADLAVDTLDDGSGLNWPVQPDGPRSFVFWCHGAAGIGRFFLHLGEIEGFPEAGAIAARAARMVAHGGRWAGPTQCHGLAGNIEFLLDTYQATGDATWLAEARTLGRLLDACAVERDGLLMWPSESSRVFTPDYMVGYAGVAMTLLRLADPDHRPHQLSRRGFQHRTASRPVRAGRSASTTLAGDLTDPFVPVPTYGGI